MATRSNTLSARSSDNPSPRLRTNPQPSPSPSRRAGASTRRVSADEQSGPASRKRKRGSGASSNGRPALVNQGSSRSRADPVVIEDVEEEDAISNTLQKQREEQVAMQDEGRKESTSLRAQTCVICMDSYTDLVATKCGHIFCNECLHESLKASEKRTSEARKSQCPVCRKPVTRKNAKTKEIIPVVFMGKSKWKPMEKT